MRALDPILIAIALIAVPAATWAFGTAAGRRNWSIGRVVAGGLVVALAVQVLKLLAVVAGDLWATPPPSQPAGDVLWRRSADVVANPEFAVFLVIFGAFMAMLAWSATPAARMDEERGP